MLTLRAAAELVYEEAKKRELPLAGVAEGHGRKGGAIEWFAGNIVQIIPVYGRKPTGPAKLGRLHGVILGEGVSATAIEDDRTEAVCDLHVREEDLKIYMRWANHTE